MEQTFNLKSLPVLDSMHDQRIANMELKEKMFILHYKDLHLKNGDFCSCDVIFSGVDDADVFAEVRRKKGLIVEGVGYYDNDFIEFIVNKEYCIETINFYHSYENVIIQAVLVDKSGKYCEDCVIRITATEVVYHWE